MLRCFAIRRNNARFGGSLLAFQQISHIFRQNTHILQSFGILPHFVGRVAVYHVPIPPRYNGHFRNLKILDALAVVLEASRRAQASPVAVRSRVPAVAPFVPRRAHNARSAYAVVARFAIGRLRAIRFFLAYSRYARFIRRADFVRIVASDAIPAYAQSRYALLVFGADFFTHRLCSREHVAVFAQFRRPCLRRHRKQQHPRQNQQKFLHNRPLSPRFSGEKYSLLYFILSYHPPPPLWYCQEILEEKCARTKKEGTFRKVSSSHFTLFFSECFAPFSP